MLFTTALAAARLAQEGAAVARTPTASILDIEPSTASQLAAPWSTARI
jgi:hypothetical protein